MGDVGADPILAKGLLQYMFQLQEHLIQAGTLVRENLQVVQGVQVKGYNWGPCNRTFYQGDRILVLLPTNESKLLACWQGPYKVIRWTGHVN